MKRLLPLLPLILSLMGCGYHVEGRNPISVTVPYVIGDYEGKLTDAIAFALSKTADYRYTREGGRWTLIAQVIEDRSDKIGYRYDRDLSSGKLEDNIVGVENRRDIIVELKIINTATGDLILGPQKVKASATYDYDRINALCDQVVTSAGTSIPMLDFSLGQLDGVAAAGEGALDPICRLLAQRIIDGMIAAGVSDAN